MTSNDHRAYPGRSPHKLPRVGKLPVHPTFPVIDTAWRRGLGQVASWT